MQVKTASRQRAVLGQLADMDLRLLQVFKAVVECGAGAGLERIVFYLHECATKLEYRSI